MDVLSLITLPISTNYTTIYRGHGAKNAVIVITLCAEWLRAWDTLATMKLWRREVVRSIPDRGTIVGWVFSPTRQLVRFSDFFSSECAFLSKFRIYLEYCPRRDYGNIQLWKYILIFFTCLLCFFRQIKVVISSVCVFQGLRTTAVPSTTPVNAPVNAPFSASPFGGFGSSTKRTKLISFPERTKPCMNAATTDPPETMIGGVAPAMTNGHEGTPSPGRLSPRRTPQLVPIDDFRLAVIKNSFNTVDEMIDNGTCFPQGFFTSAVEMMILYL